MSHRYYLADTPGRLRIESPMLKGDSAALARFWSIVMNGVPSPQRARMTVTFKPVLGSALIEYDPAIIDHKALIAVLDASGYFDSKLAETPDEVLGEVCEKAAEVVVESIK